MAARMHPATARYAEHVNPAFVRLLGAFGYGRVFLRADGMELYDSEGRRYLDFLAGFGTNNLGHNPPALIARLQAALAEELPNVMHVGPQAWAGELGEALAKRVPALPLCLLSLSGSEAVEAAMKLARAATGRPGIVYCTGGFHGTGLGALSVMGHARWQRPFQPLLPECHAVPFGDLDALDSVLAKNKVAGFLVEPILGEGGVVFPPDGYLLEAQRLCVQNGALFMLDEVQTGLGRTGSWFAFQQTPHLDPDVLILGKALGSGLLPISATLTRRHLHQAAYGDLWKFDLHGSTYAGYALGCIAALETLRVIEEDDLLAKSRARGAYLVEQLQNRLGSHPLVKDVRGSGLLVALELGNPGGGLLAGLRQALVPKQILCQWLSVRLLELGFVCQPASQQWNCLKLTPPLTLGDEHVDRLAGAVGGILDEYKSISKLAKDVTKRLGTQLMGGWQFG